jgi:hypothetical protein
MLALGLLAGVLASIAGLFVIGAGQVRSGRTATEALTVARTILEEIEGWSFDATYTNFGYDGSAASYTVDTRTAAAAAAWQAGLDESLYGSYATVSIAAIDPGGPVLSDSSQIRVMVTVYWVEGQRQRSVRLGTVRM